VQNQSLCYVKDSHEDEFAVSALAGSGNAPGWVLVAKSDQKSPSLPDG